MKATVITATMPGREALLAEAEVSSSIEILHDAGDDGRRSLELDWMLEITLEQAASPVERRRATVKCAIERRAKQWKVTALDPIDFFRPPAAPAR